MSSLLFRGHIRSDVSSPDAKTDFKTPFPWEQLVVSPHLSPKQPLQLISRSRSGEYLTEQTVCREQTRDSIIYFFYVVSQCFRLFRGFVSNTCQPLAGDGTFGVQRLTLKFNRARNFSPGQPLTAQTSSTQRLCVTPAARSATCVCSCEAHA